MSFFVWDLPKQWLSGVARAVTQRNWCPLLMCVRKALPAEPALSPVPSLNDTVVHTAMMFVLHAGRTDSQLSERSMLRWCHLVCGLVWVLIGVHFTGSNGRNLLMCWTKEDFEVLSHHRRHPLEECQEPRLLGAVRWAQQVPKKPAQDPNVMAPCLFLRKSSKDFFALFWVWFLVFWLVCCLFVSHIRKMLWVLWRSF